MFIITHKESLAEKVIRCKILAPKIAKKRKAGQFVMVQADEKGERIPLTIADSDPEEGTITLIFQVVGRSTIKLASLSQGEAIENVLGPLGNPTHIEKWGRVAAIGGGVGIAPLYPIVKAMKEANNELSLILGARTRDLLILENEMSSMVKDLRICTDDGSSGRKGLVTAELKELIQSPAKPDLVMAIGPLVMMKAVCEATRPFGITTYVSLNPIMVDGTGMCGGCRVNVGGHVRFACVDGPEFNGHEVDFDNLGKRLSAYKEMEQHACRLSGNPS